MRSRIKPWNQIRKSPKMEEKNSCKRHSLMRKLPPLNALKAFEACARCRSFTLAAEELLVTQSAVSKQIKGLEDYLGVRLFLRQPRQLELTQHGKALLPTLTQIFDRLASITSELQLKAHDLRIKLPPTFAIRWLIPRLRQFQEQNPDLEVLLSTGWNPVNFMKEDFDGAIVCSNDIDHYDHTIEADLIVEERLTPVCSPKLLQDGPPLREPRDLMRYTLLHGSELFDFWQAWFESIGVEVDPGGKSQKFDLMDTALHAANRGFGIALAPRQFIMEEVALGHLLMPFPEITPALTGYFFVSPKNSATQQRVEKFRRWLIETAGVEWDESLCYEDLIEPPVSNLDPPAAGNVIQ